MRELREEGSSHSQQFKKISASVDIIDIDNVHIKERNLINDDD